MNPLDPESVYTRAAKAEIAKDFDLAFKLYIKAAEDFLHQSRTTTEERAKSQLKSRAGVALQRAEKIKSIRRDLTPVVRNPFSERKLRVSPESQLSVLKKSSRVNGREIRLWAEARLQEDPIVQPDLSPAQIDRRSVWKSPSEIFPDSSITSTLLQPHDIVQRVVTDCSVCASLVVCLEHDRRFKSKLGVSVLYPRDNNNIVCEVPPGSLHEVCFRFNGAFRRIVVDDKLPVSQETNDLSCLSTGSVPVLWPALIEKAYIKLMGGYDFPGSDSSTDLHTIIGWIPEHLAMNTPKFQREKTWTRIRQGFTEGRCVLTLGTADRSDIYWRNVHILPVHCYAVTELTERDGERHVIVLDSWLQGSQRSLPPDSRSQVLAMTWDEVCEVFEEVYLSWDPASFPHTLSFHGLWKPKGVSGEEGAGLHQHLRLNMKDATEPAAQHSLPSVWVLLTRHITDTRRTSDYIALRVEREFDRKIEQKIDQIADRGIYSNSSHVLVQATPQEIKEGALSLIASYDGDLEDVGFTLTVYSTTVFLSWDESPARFPFFQKIEGSFTSKSAGGNHTFPSFMTNPQYRLHVHPDKASVKSASRGGRGEKAMVRIFGQAGKEVPFNVAVVWSDGTRVSELVQSDVVCSSGTYGYGYAAAAGDLFPGDYTMIVSAFEPQKYLGPYSIRVESSRRFDLQPIPQEGAGMYSKVVKGAWDASSAGGGPRSAKYLENPLFDLQVTATCQLKVRLQLARPSPSVSLNVTLFPASPTPVTLKSLGRHIATSGPYIDSISGVVTPLTIFQPGNYLILPSTFQEGVEEVFKIEVFSTVAGVKVQLRKR